MHTSRFESCSIIHNGDYSGEIIITNENQSLNYTTLMRLMKKIGARSFDE